MKKVYFLFFCCFLQASVTAQQLTNSFEQFYLNFYQEKVYVSHDKPFYLPGDTVWCSLWHLNARTNTFFDAEPVVYLDWINPDGVLIQKLTLKVNQGQAPAEFAIPENAPLGTYHLRAYTNYQRNFEEGLIFHKPIVVASFDSSDSTAASIDFDYSVQFFPEGGNLVANIENKLAFQIQRSDGTFPAEANIVIKDANDNEIITAKTLQDGVGVFKITPQSKGSYFGYAMVNNQVIAEAKMPLALPESIGLSVNSRKIESIDLELNAAPKANLAGTILLCTHRGKVLFDRTISEKKNQVSLTLDKKGLPTGLLYLTLFGSDGTPISERVIFSKNPLEAIDLQVITNFETYAPRDSVSFKLKLENNPDTAAAISSIAVFDAEFFPPDKHTWNIENYLLLQSELPCPIPNLSSYFSENSVANNYLLDVVLMVYGWRQFTWSDILAEKLPGMVYPPEERLRVAGKVTRQNGEAVAADVSISVLEDNLFGAGSLTTDADGLFHFSELNLFDTTNLVLKANVHNPRKKTKVSKGNIKRKGSKNVNIELINIEQYSINNSLLFKNLAPDSYWTTPDFKNLAFAYKNQQAYSNPDIIIDLETVTVARQKLDYRQKRERAFEDEIRKSGMFYFGNSQKLFLEDLPTVSNYLDVYELIRARINGAKVFQENGEKFVQLNRGITSFQKPSFAIIMVDGVQVSAVSAANIPPDQIKVIEVVRGLSSTSVFGEAGGNGIIRLITKNPGDQNFAPTYEAEPKGILEFQHPGFYQARRFYQPTYRTADQESSVPDLRTSLYWNPSQKISQEGNQLHFFTGDRPSTYVIYVEGLTKSGIPFTKSHTFELLKP